MVSKKNRPVGLISSVPFEGNLILRHLEEKVRRARGGLLYYTGRLGKRSVVYMVSGMGKTNAAHGASVLIREFSPSAIINFGVGGAYPGSGLLKGQIAVCTGEVYADEGVRLKDGFHSLELIGIPVATKRGKRFFNAIPVDQKLARALVRSSTRITGTLGGTFATVSTCSGTKRAAREISGKTNALCENMEGAAIAHICLLHDIPFAEIRAISNIVEDRDTSKWEIGTASENCQRALMEFLSSRRS